MAFNIALPRTAPSIPRVDMKWVGEGNLGAEHNPAQETVVSYHNYLDVPVWVGERSGAVSLLPPRQGQERIFGVRVSRRFHRSTTVSYNIHEMTEQRIGALRPDQALHAMHETYNPVFSSQVGMGKSRDVVFTLNRPQLEDYGGAAYHEATDIVISLTREGAMHPGSPQARMLALRHELNDDGDPLFLNHPRISVAVIDNERVYGDKYVNLNGVVHLVKAVSDARYESGIYVLRDGVANEAGQSSSPTVTRYRFEEALESDIGLYDSREQALHRGDPEKVAEQHTVQLKSEAVILKNRLENETLKSKIDTSKEQNKLDEESMRRKDYYEDRSYRRKDNSDELKYFFAGIAGLFGILAIFLKK